MKTCFRVILLFVSACVLPASVLAQTNLQNTPTFGVSPYDKEQAVWMVSGRVKTIHGDPVKGASVTVSPLVPAASRVLTTDAQGEFKTIYQLNIIDVTEFSLILTVKKKEFRTAHQYINFGPSAKSWVIPVTLREPGEDPDLLSSADLLSGLAPRLKQLGPADGLAAKSAQDYTRGVAEFLDKQRPEKALPILDRVLQRNPSCIGCRTMLALVDLSWEDWSGADRALAEAVNQTLTKREMARPEPLVAYGTCLSWQHEPEKAQPYFMEALKLAPKDALALQELGRVLLSMQQSEAATDVLGRALAARGGPETRLLYVEALVGSNRPDEATAEMNRYLDGREVKKMPVRVRQVWASIQDRKKVDAAYAKAKLQKGPTGVDFLLHPPADLIAGLEPAKDQGPLSSILDGVGTGVLELIKNFPNTSSLEAIHQEKLGHKGAVHDEQDQKFRYLCIVPRDASGPVFTEYRADFAGNAAQPKGLDEGFMLTSGFTSAEFFFHPVYRTESNFRYLGQQNVNGQNTYVVAFAQIPGRARITGDFRRGQSRMTTYSQGLAWIDPATYRIVRLHTDLLAPLPEQRLEKQAMNIDFNEVHFNHVKDGLWLPKQVTVTLDWNGKTLRNMHAYSDFKIFNVDATEKIGKPKNAAESSPPPKESTVSP